MGYFLSDTTVLISEKDENVTVKDLLTFKLLKVVKGITLALYCILE